MNDPYKTLHVNRSASPDEIQSAYRKLAKRWHPDRNAGDAKAEARFKEIQAAWDLLSDPDRKARFDATGDTSEDRSDREVQAVLTATLNAVLQAHLGQTNWTKPSVARSDLVAEMRKHIKTGRDNCSAEVRRLERVVVDLTDAAERFVVLDGGGRTTCSATPREPSSTSRRKAWNRPAISSPSATRSWST